MVDLTLRIWHAVTTTDLFFFHSEKLYCLYLSKHSQARFWKRCAHICRTTPLIKVNVSHRSD
jgi:hypothetical protein